LHLADLLLGITHDRREVWSTALNGVRLQVAIPRTGGDPIFFGDDDDRCRRTSGKEAPAMAKEWVAGAAQIFRPTVTRMGDGMEGNR